MVQEAVGTWKNGTLLGPGKIIMDDKSMLIANFQNGRPSGFIRKFKNRSNDANLTELYYEDLRENKNAHGNKLEKA